MHMLRFTSQALFRNNVFQLRRTSQLIRPTISLSRHYANKSSPSQQQPISDYIASQPPPSNPETPPDRMPHQTEEDIATENIFEKSGNKNGLPEEAVPVQEILKEDPAAMKKAPKVIKEESQ